jgi:hypothetical protein
MANGIVGSGEFRSSVQTVEFRLARRTKPELLVTGALVGNQTIVEGDIAFPLVTQEGIVITGSQFHWPDATVPYEIADGFPNPDRIIQAMAEWTTRTRVRFVERASQTDYVRFEDLGGCFSSVGRVGGKQIISLGAGCTKGNAVHEIGHTLGLWHEQSREDRDMFVDILWANIDPGMRHNFDQHIVDGDDTGLYDYGSIMHYPRNAFSMNGQDTIVPKGGQEIGQRIALSAGDIAAIQQLYP